jgi:Rab GDP dissociation inhibitor
MADEPSEPMKEDESKGDDVGAKGDGKDAEPDEEKAPSFDWMPAGCAPMADGEYDAIVMGTGLKECILSGLLSVKGMKVLHVDRNNYYGAECASLNLTNLFEKFNAGQAPPQAFFDALGKDRDYNVDLIPKCIMATGKLVKILLHTKVTRYLEWKSIDASYVYKKEKVFKVPATGTEAISSSLLGLFEKRRFRNFLMYLADYDKDKPASHKGYDLRTMTMEKLYDEYGLETGTRQFVGHAMALEIDDSYLGKPALDCVEAIQLYCYSLDRYGKSPYIYPLYGLGGLPEGFSRLCAIHGGTFMLNRAVSEVLYDDKGVAWGIRGAPMEPGGPEEVAKAKFLIGDPSYFLGSDDPSAPGASGKVKVTGRVTRAICIMDHPMPNTKDVDSVQCIIPAAEARRTTDIYVMVISHAQCVAAKGKYIAIVSTTVETDNPKAELEPGIRLLGKLIARFDSVAYLYDPLGDGAGDKCYISKSYDATSHFETTSVDVLDMYRRITGEELDMNINADNLGGDY